LPAEQSAPQHYATTETRPMTVPHIYDHAKPWRTPFGTLAVRANGAAWPRKVQMKEACYIATSSLTTIGHEPLLQKLYEKKKRKS